MENNNEKDYPAEEQGIEPEETSEEKSEDMEHGEKDEDVYSEEGREKLVEDGEISPGDGSRDEISRIQSERFEIERNPSRRENLVDKVP